MPRILLTAAAALAAAVAVPSVAHGATLQQDGRTPHKLLLQDELGETNLVSVEGLDGDDEITGGTGVELLSGGPGNDRIDARDGAPDNVDCGGQALDWAAVDGDAEASVTGCAEIGS